MRSDGLQTYLTPVSSSDYSMPDAKVRFMRNTSTKFSPWIMACAGFAASFLVFSLRRPDIISNPSFWAEDGYVWFRQAYSDGIISIIWPQNGYYQSISKITALLSMILPMEYAPLFFNIIGLTVRSLFVAYILTSRLSSFPLSLRLIMCAYIVLMPGLIEVHANITNTHWYLSMWLLCVLLSNRPPNTAWFIHDIFLMLLAGLSGPFVVFLVPVFLLRFCLDSDFRSYLRTSKGLFFAGALVAVCAIQVIAVLMSFNETRSSAPLGFSFGVMANILSARVFVGAFLTAEQFKWLFNHGLLNALVAVICLSLLAWVFLKSDWRLKSIVLFASTMLFFALSKPMLSLTEPQLPLLFAGGERYFVITNIAWVAVILAAYSQLKRNLNRSTQGVVVAAAVVAFAFVAAFNFSIEPLADTKWATQAKEFEALPAGGSYEFQLNPASWKMTMIR